MIGNLANCTAQQRIQLLCSHPKSQMPWLFEEPTLAVKYSETIRSNVFQVTTAMTLNKYFCIKTLTCCNILTCWLALWYTKVFHFPSWGENSDFIIKASPKILVPYLGILPTKVLELKKGIRFTTCHPSLRLPSCEAGKESWRLRASEI